ncbi:response regulator transcription factor [Quadrisphaera sp. DSM 44207]|uniref:response regulator n=1 Tax=Quadrisphaera sp. DSM 44207 TaxID=1881057 RepID=UPI00088A54A2|nr:response regulator transcription factor [Quadrisphaera sp. DSM 44207]SDQ78491.1 two component transcriptional regulator, LuxR family [Quadrisphaera sp. DSM 44207]
MSGAPAAGDRVVRVVLVDDQDLVRTGFRMILGVEPDLQVVGEAADGAAAVALVRATAPDVVLMDVQMPGVDGLTATREVVATTCSAVVVLTTFDRDDYLFAALEAGASGFLLKNAGPEELVAAVRLVAAGEALLDPAVTRRVIERFAARPGRAARPDLLTALTEREREVLVLLARGWSNAEIAQCLVLSEATVKTHVSHLLAKLGLRDRVQAVVHAYETGLVAPGEGGPPPGG